MCTAPILPYQVVSGERFDLLISNPPPRGTHIDWGYVFHRAGFDRTFRERYIVLVRPCADGSSICGKVYKNPIMGSTHGSHGVGNNSHSRTLSLAKELEAMATIAVQHVEAQVT